MGEVPEIGPTGPNLCEATVAAITSAIGEDGLSATIPAASATADGLGVNAYSSTSTSCRSMLATLPSRRGCDSRALRPS